MDRQVLLGGRADDLGGHLLVDVRLPGVGGVPIEAPAGFLRQPDVDDPVRQQQRVHVRLPRRVVLVG
jgi:hypothetical protein